MIPPPRSKKIKPVKKRIEKSSASVGSHISFEVGKPTFRVLTLPSAAQLSGKLFYSGRRQSLLTRPRSLRRGCGMRRSEGMKSRRKRWRTRKWEGGKKRSRWDRRAEENWKVKKLPLVPPTCSSLTAYCETSFTLLTSLSFYIGLFIRLYLRFSFSFYFPPFLTMTHLLLFLARCSFTSHFISRRERRASRSSIRKSSATVAYRCDRERDVAMHFSMKITFGDVSLLMFARLNAGIQRSSIEHEVFGK